MLKIKSNTNKFTIIFFWEDWKENKWWKILCSSPLFLSASAPHLLVFLFQPSLFCFLFLCFSLLFFLFSTTFLASLDVLPYFFSPKHFFSPNTFSAQELFQPKTFFSPLLFICGSAPPSFLLFSPSFFLKRLILFFLPTSKAKNILFRCFTFLLFE